jgi:integrase
VERHLTPAELARLGKALREARRHKAISWQALGIFELMALTGARPKEVCGATKAAVSLEEGVLRLDEAKGDRPGRKKGRAIWLSSAAVAAIRALPSWNQETPYLFPGAKQGSFFKTLHRPWHRLCEMARIPDATPYSFRHTFVTQGGAAGVPLEEVSDLVGHAGVEITNRVYRHGDSALQRNSAERLGKHIDALLREGEQEEP